MAMRIGELGTRTGLATSTLRYYEEAGLLQPAARSEAGYRLYRPDAVGRLSFIRRAQALGLSVREISSLIASPSADNETERSRLRHLVAHKLVVTKQRLADLRSLEDDLERLYVRLMHFPAAECGHVGDCGCWLPTEEEVRMMSQEVACCGQQCCPDCACSDGEPCDCEDCPCAVS